MYTGVLAFIVGPPVRHLTDRSCDYHVTTAVLSKYIRINGLCLTPGLLLPLLPPSQIASVSRNLVPWFGPSLYPQTIFSHGELCKKLLRTKVINAVRATYLAPKFVRMTVSLSCNDWYEPV